MPQRIRITQVMDAKTGEILQETREAFHASDWYVEGRGYKLYGRAKTKLGPWVGWSHLSLHERGVLITIITMMDRDNRLPSVSDALAPRMGVGVRRAYAGVARLVGVGAVARHGSDFFLNPAIAFAGIYLSPFLYKLFQPDMADIVPKWARKAYDAQEDG